LSNSTHKAPSAQQWSSNPLLASTVERHPPFMRAKWDAQHAESFGPWRIAPSVDPTAAIELASPNFESATSDAEHNDGEGHASHGASTQAPSEADPAQDHGDVNARISSGDLISKAQLTEALAEAEARGKEQGVAQGREQLQQELAEQRAQEREIMRGLSIELHAMAENPDRYFEPLRRLALHLAEQLVRAELTVSEQAISQLVRQCLAQLEPPGESAVVTLHPDDLALIQDAAAQELAQSVSFEGNASLLRGSVQVRRHDARVDDLIEDRLQTLVEQLQINPQSWRDRSVLLKPLVDDA
jgi:flagellar biosynthesis/type III secretory pathway protein FliH